MIVNDSNYRGARFWDWQETLACIYQHKDMMHNPFSLWMEVVNDGSKIIRGIRLQYYDTKEDFEQQIIKPMLHSLAWCCSYSMNFVGTLDDILWENYPGLCPHCVDIPCRCPKNEPASPIIKNNPKLIEARRKTQNKPTSIDQWVQFFDRLYGQRWDHNDFNLLGTHLMEEIGEMGRVIRTKEYFDRIKYRIIFNEVLIENKKLRGMATDYFQWPIERELASVTSWILSLAILTLKRHEKLVSQQVSLSQLMFDEFGNKCPRCQSTVCICGIDLEQVIRQIQEDECEEALANIDDLKELFANIRQQRG